MRHRGIRDRYEYTSGTFRFTPAFIVDDGLCQHNPELQDWLRWAAEGGNTQMFVRTVGEAGLIACSTDYELLRPVLIELKRRYHEG